VAMDISKLTDKAREAVQRRNYGYAIELYQQALALSPDDVETRKELRATAARHTKESGTGKFAGLLKGLVPLLKVVFLGMAKKYEKQMIECERFLAKNPSNRFVLTKLGEAANATGCRATAVHVFGDLVAGNPKDLNSMKQLARAHEASGDIRSSLEVYEGVLRVSKHDQEASQKMRDLSARQTTAVYQREGGSWEKQKDREKTVKRDRAAGELRTSEDINAALDLAKEAADKHPELPQNWNKLGDLYRRLYSMTGDEAAYEGSKQAFSKAREILSSDYRFTMCLEDLELLRYRRRLNELAARVKGGDQAARAEYATLRKEYGAYELDSFVRRTKHYPTDVNIAFQLANVYYARKMLDEAISQYQQARDNPANRTVSLDRLGLCFASKGQHDLAIKQFEDALSEMEIMNEEKKGVLYNLADTYERMGKAGEAKAAFTKIYETDIQFKDVTERLKKLG